MSWNESLDQKLSSLSNSEFDYTETTDLSKTSELGLGCTGIFTDATVVYFEIKNMTYLLKENGRRKTAQVYTMYNEVLSALAEQTGGVLNCFSPTAFLVIYPGKEESIKQAVTGALKVVYALTETYKQHFTGISNLEFAMGLDHGHIMGTKVLSDYGTENIAWFGTCIYKAIRICQECARPFYVGISGSIYHSLDESLRTTTRRILGIKKSVEMWTKITYQYENVKKHLYQSNHKIPIVDEK